MAFDKGQDVIGLPFDMRHYDKTKITAGTNVYFPNTEEGQVIKVDRTSPNYSNLRDALNKVLEYRRMEEIAKESASSKTKMAIVDQHYVLAEGTTPSTYRIVRTQEYVDGVELRQLGFEGIMKLELDDIVTLRTIVADSIKCYLKNGVNFDLVGSDERDTIKKSLFLNIQRHIFPLRHSSNLMKTSNGIKLVDPNVYGKMSKTDGLKRTIQKGLLFASSVADYVILSGRKMMLERNRQ